MRPHTVGDIARSSARRLGTGSSVSFRRTGTGNSLTLRPSTGGSNFLSPEEFTQLQQQCKGMQERLDRLETAIEEGDFSNGKDKAKNNDDEGGILPTHLGIRFNQVRSLNLPFIFMVTPFSCFSVFVLFPFLAVIHFVTHICHPIISLCGRLKWFGCGRTPNNSTQQNRQQQARQRKAYLYMSKSI